MTTPQQRNLISSAGFIGLVAAMKEPAETYVKCNQVRLRASNAPEAFCAAGDHGGLAVQAERRGRSFRQNARC
jgi:hypothetical protein